MANKYRTLIDLKLAHAFYHNGKLPGMQVVALPGTARQLRNHRMMLKQNADGLKILQECTDKDGELNPLVKPDEPLELAFGIHTGDPLLQVKTEIDFFSSTKQKMVFDLRDTTAETVTGELLPCCSGRFVYSPETLTPGEYRITNGKGKTVLQKNAGRNDTQLVFDLSEENENKYSIENAAGVLESFVLVQRDAGYDGIIILRSGETEATHEVKFRNRNIHWEYTVVPKYNTYTDLMLLEESDKILFERTAHPEINGAWLFTSSTPVRVQERYEYAMLISDQGRVIKKQIPFGDLKNTGICLINVENFCLKTFVMV